MTPRHYIEGSSWPLGTTQIAAMLALTAAKKDGIGHYDAEGWRGCDLRQIAARAKLDISRNAMRECMNTLIRRGLVEKFDFNKRIQAYRLTGRGRSEAKRIAR